MSTFLTKSKTKKAGLLQYQYLHMPKNWREPGFLALRHIYIPSHNVHMHITFTNEQAQ